MAAPLSSIPLRADVGLYRLVRAQGRHRAAVSAALLLSHFGEHALGWLAIGAIGTAVDREQRRPWARATVSVAAAHGVNVAVKRVVRRPRPSFEDLPALGRTPSQLSFPSAHAASTFAAAEAYSRLLPRSPLRAAAAAMGLSRVLLGVHYPSDVLAGALLGTAVGRLARGAAVRAEQTVDARH